MSSIVYTGEGMLGIQPSSYQDDFWLFAKEARESNFNIIPPYGSFGDLITDRFCFNQSPFFQSQMPGIRNEIDPILKHAERGSAFVLPSSSSIVNVIDHTTIVGGGAAAGGETSLRKILTQSDTLFHELRKQHGNKIMESRHINKFEKAAQNHPLRKSIQAQVSSLPNVLKNKWGTNNITNPRAIRNLALKQGKLYQSLNSTTGALKTMSRRLVLVSFGLSTYQIATAKGGKDNTMRVAAREAVGLGLGWAAGVGGVWLGTVAVTFLVAAVGATTAPVWVTALVVGAAVVGAGYMANYGKDFINERVIHAK